MDEKVNLVGWWLVGNMVCTNAISNQTDKILSVLNIQCAGALVSMFSGQVGQEEHLWDPLLLQGSSDFVSHG